jgi:hypothetical protein
VDFEALGLPSLDLSELNAPFTEEEIWGSFAICQQIRPLGLMDSLVYKVAWLVIKNDVMNALVALSNLHTCSFYLVNGAILILLPKSSEPKGIGDYGPISLIHNFGKLVSKALANRVAPQLSAMILPNQNAFMKGHQMHNNFCYVHGTTKTLQARKAALHALQD